MTTAKNMKFCQSRSKLSLALVNVRFGDLRYEAAVGLPQQQKYAASAKAAIS
ncbi:MAG: hypothetical protein AAFN63_09875 [Pseudomonadota bacterium]